MCGVPLRPASASLETPHVIRATYAGSSRIRYSYFIYFDYSLDFLLWDQVGFLNAKRESRVSLTVSYIRILDKLCALFIVFHSYNEEPRYRAVYTVVYNTNKNVERTSLLLLATKIE